MFISPSRGTEMVDYIDSCPGTFCDYLGALPRKSAEEQQREEIFSLASRVFYSPCSFLQSPSLHKHQLVVLMAVTQDPELVVQEGFPSAFGEDLAVLRTALVAAKRLKKEGISSLILEAHTDPSLLSFESELQQALSLSRLWTLQIRDNPQLYPLLPLWLQTDEDVMQAALRGDGRNVRYLSGGNQSRVDLIRLAMTQYPDAWRFSPLGVQLELEGRGASRVE